MRIGLIASVFLLAAGGLTPATMPVIGTAANISAVGVLAWVVWTQLKEIKLLRLAHSDVVDRLCERWDAWEKIRHEDSAKLDDTLLKMTQQCADTRHACENRTGG